MREVKTHLYSGEKNQETLLTHIYIVIYISPSWFPPRFISIYFSFFWRLLSLIFHYVLPVSSADVRPLCQFPILSP